MCVLALALQRGMHVYMMQELQADRGVVQNNPAQLMETMNPTMRCHPTGQKQERGASLMPARRSSPHTFLSPLPTSRALFLRIRNSYNFLHVIKSYGLFESSGGTAGGEWDKSQH